MGAHRALVQIPAVQGGRPPVPVSPSRGDGTVLLATPTCYTAAPLSQVHS